MDYVSRQLLMSGGSIPDQYFANVSTLLHYDGADGSTTYTDSGPNGLTYTTVYSPTISTSQSKFGGSSGAFSGTNYITTADNLALGFGSGDFTIETFVRFAALPSAAALFLKTGAGNTRSYGLYQFNNGGVQSLYFTYSTTGEFWTDIMEAYTPPVNTWLHYAVVRTGNFLLFFVDGVQIGSAHSLSSTIANVNAPLSIGSGLNGWLDESRMTKGVARYTGAFTPPAAPFPNF